MKSTIYFILSCARSGSTSLTKILSTGTNGKCLVEPLPNLNVETREAMEGRLKNPHEVLAQQILPRIGQALDRGEVYGEKNLTFGPFIPHLHRMLRCKFIFLTRDGRDVTTSLINWHNEAFGTIYRECRDPGQLSPLAKAAHDKLPIEMDTSDISRPRPAPSDPYYAEWPSFSRFEMCAWYWNYINRLYLDQLATIPPEDWMRLDYSSITSDGIRNVFEFLGLTGFDQTNVQSMLDSKINSVWDRFKLAVRFPSHKSWDADQHRRFDRIARPMMEELGYVERRSARRAG